jgi:hypothetical protein
MALSATFDADFSDFVQESNKAAAALTSIHDEADATSNSVADMASRTTVSAEQAATALEGMGAKAGAGSLPKLTSGLRSVDASMNALGFSISKPVAALEELSTVATKGVSSLGALGTAGAVLAAAIAAWEFGKWSMQFTGMADTWDRIYESWGMNAIQAETLANKQEVLAKASKTSGRTITDLTEAMKINYDAVKGGTKEMDNAIHRQALWEKEIRQHRAELPAMSAAIDNHTATVADLSREYKMSEAAITFYLAKTKDQTAAQDEATRKTEAAAEAQKKLRDQMFGTEHITKANEYQLALGGIQNLTKMTTEEQAKLNTEVGLAIEAYKRMGKEAPPELNKLYSATVSIGTVTGGLGSEWGNVGTKFDVSIDHILKGIEDAKKAAADYEAETQRMAQEYIDGQYKGKAATDQTTAAVERMTVAMRDFGSVNRSAWESMTAGAELMKAYQDAGIFVGMQGGAMTGYQAQQRNRMATEAPAAGAAWGNTLNVNVNSTDANDIAGKLVTEMRMQGVRF